MIQIYYQFLYITTQKIISDQNNNEATNNTNQNITSTLSTSNTHITQPFQTQQPSTRNCDPPSPPSQYLTETTRHDSPQQGSSTTHGTNAPQIQPTVQFQTTTPTRQPVLRTLAYTPAQNIQTQNIQTSLTINTLHSNALPTETF